MGLAGGLAVETQWKEVKEGFAASMVTRWETPIQDEEWTFSSGRLDQVRPDGPLPTQAGLRGGPWPGHADRLVATQSVTTFSMRRSGTSQMRATTQ